MKDQGDNSLVQVHAAIVDDSNFGEVGPSLFGYNLPTYQRSWWTRSRSSDLPHRKIANRKIANKARGLQPKTIERWRPNLQEGKPAVPTELESSMDQVINNQVYIDHLIMNYKSTFTYQIACMEMNDHNLTDLRKQRGSITIEPVG